MKSKIIQSSKDMLSRSFNPAKCKVSLKLAISRLKLLRNNKEEQAKRMRKEIALLLESGQDQTALIRVGHVIREEKLMAAYELLGIYCEIIVGRLPIIESQKTCPVDLKEAIASVVFASPRCGDVPELLDAKKHFTAKYGKDFTTAAIELRPQCGVSRLLIEKLSAGSPDGQTKIRILSMIADQHNVAWNSMSVDANYPGSHMELQTGPSTSRVDANSDVKPSRFEVQTHRGNDNMHSSVSNLSQHAPVGADKPASAPSSSVSDATQSRAKPSVDVGGHPFEGDSNEYFMDRQKWNMEFRDAASAAKAAAESAERANMAARAVAELSRHKKSKEEFRSGNRPSSGNAGLSDEKMDPIEPFYPQTENHFEDVVPGAEVLRHTSSKLGASTFDESVDDHGGRLKQDSSLKYPEQVPVIVGSSQKHAAGTKIGMPDKSEFNVESFGKSHSVSSSHHSDDVNIFAVPEDTKVENDAYGDPFINVVDGGSTHDKVFKESTSNVSGKYDSDSDDSFQMGPVYDVGDPGISSESSEHHFLEDLPLHPAPLSPRYISTNIFEPSPPLFTRENSSPNFRETSVSMNGSEDDILATATFDDSDGDERTNRHQKGLHPSEQYVEDEVEQSYSDEEKMSPAHVQWKFEEMQVGRNAKGPDSPEKSRKKPILEKPAFVSEEANTNYNYDSSPVSGARLNLDNLTSGLRNKRYMDLPFSKNKLGVSPSVEKKDSGTAIATSSENSPAALSPKVNRMVVPERNTGMPPPDMEFENESSGEEEYLQKTSKLEAYYTNKEKDKSASPSPRASVSHNSNVFAGSPKWQSARSHLQGAISRRTKASHSASVTNSSPRLHLRSESVDSDVSTKSNPGREFETQDYDASPRTDPPRSSVTTAKQGYHLENRMSGKASHFGQLTTSKVISEPTNSSVTATSKTQDGKSTQKSSHVSKPLQKPAASVTSEPQRTELTKRPSHVHPKLPDYDVLMQSFGNSRS